MTFIIIYKSIEKCTKFDAKEYSTLMLSISAPVYSNFHRWIVALFIRNLRFFFTLFPLCCFFRPINGKTNSPRRQQKEIRKADASPIEIDPTVNWSSVGGLKTHIKLLKEMIMLPLLYPEVWPSNLFFLGSF